MKTIISYWQKVPAPVRTWLKGLEVFVLMGVVTSLMAAPFADFTTKGGIAKFAGIVAATAGGCVRLYLIQSPVQNVIQETVLASKSPSGPHSSPHAINAIVDAVAFKFNLAPSNFGVTTFAIVK